MLAVGAAAIGWTTHGDEVAAGITAVAFLICAVLLLARAPPTRGPATR
jgi:hypothetical protein